MPWVPLHGMLLDALEWTSTLGIITFNTAISEIFIKR